ncbi:MAG: OmpH family outer membrane protein [Deltaproteobacteria bacterium]|nr:OmpH family outer membrane protein [Deltaproteobacteria bacterium]
MQRVGVRWRNVWCGVSAAVLLCGIPLVHAASESTPRIGYVDLQRALNNVNEGRRAKGELERIFTKRRTELESLKTTLEKKQQELEKDRHILSAEALQQKQEAYRNELLTLTQKMNTYEGELAQKESETTGAILNALRHVVRKLGADEGFEVILETSQDVVLFSPTKSDLTERVIERYNALPESQRRIPVRK